MKIALLHYHLKPGGVTTVIRHQVDVLKRDCSLLVLCGAPPCPAWASPCIPILGLGYQSAHTRARDPRKVAAEIHQAIRNHWGGDCDLLHVHNPILAKNPTLLDILEALQDRGITLFLQVHDFAEDGRPHAYFRAAYPRDCHYGVVNSRDYQVLLKAGLKREGLHMLSNPVRPLEEDRPPSLPGEDVLYPVRAIRRKNIGEALLMSLFFKDNPHLSITLPPNSPADMAAYIGWKNFSKAHNLPIRFESGIDCDFEQLVDRARFLLTTSITEGFGYAFLEAWTAHKMVHGRNLADITQDFTRRGLRLGHLYPRLMIPFSWFDRRLFLTRWKTSFLENSSIFGLPFEKQAVDQAAEKMLETGWVDFGMLDEFFQKQVLRALLADPGKKEHLKDINPFLENPAAPDEAHRLISHNRQVVLKEFNAGAYRNRLLAAYKAAQQRTVKQRIDKYRLAAFFLNPKAFSLLKWGVYVE